MKKLLLSFTFSMLSFLAMSQTDEKAKDFEKVRNEDFTKLIGGFQEGFRLNYNPEKANIEFSKAKQIYKQFYIQGTGAIGTTTNLTSLFEQDLLPTYSGALTAHFLLSRGSIYSYDSTFQSNLSQIKNTAINISSINTDLIVTDPNTNVTETFKAPFKYREPLRDKVTSGKLKGRFYTFKRLNWFSLTTKHDYAKYAFYDPLATFSSQLTNPQYRTWSVKLNYNFFLSWNKTDARWLPAKWNLGTYWRPDFVYLTVGISRGLGNNVAGLKKKTVQTITSEVIDPASGTVRQVIDSKTVYQGEYRQYATTSPSAELIIAPFRQIAIFGNVESNLIEKSEKERYSLNNTMAWAGGVYFYGNGNGSKINIGIFYREAQDPLTENWIGTFNLRTSIPITPL